MSRDQATLTAAALNRAAHAHEHAERMRAKWKAALGDAFERMVADPGNVDARDDIALYQWALSGLQEHARIVERMEGEARQAIAELGPAQ